MRAKFCDEVFLPEHRHPLSVVVHVVGTAASAALLPLAWLWFIAGNHRMTWDLMTRGFYWR